jgi:hypothetical protein
MEEIKELVDAWEGDLIDYKGKTLRVINTEIIEAGYFKRIRAVNINPLFKFTRVITIIV